MHSFTCVLDAGQALMRFLRTADNSCYHWLLLLRGVEVQGAPTTVAVVAPAGVAPAANLQGASSTVAVVAPTASGRADRRKCT